MRKKYNNIYISEILPLFHKIMEGYSLTSEETRKAFATIIREDKDGYFFLAFFAILSTKSESVEELYGLCQALSEFCPKLNLGIDPNAITDLSGTGGAKIKTINVSTAASFIVASAGIKVAKQAFPGITSPTGSADVFQAFGINVFSITRDLVKKGIYEVGIIPYNVAFSLGENLDNLRNFGKLQFERGLAIRTPMHLIANVFSPFNMRRRVYGIFSEKYLDVTAQLFQKLGYIKGMVFHGLDGLCEISNIGQTKIIEFDNVKRKEYIVGPDDFGIMKAKYEDIKAINPEQNIIDFLRVLSGEEKGPKRDIVLLNAASALYIMDKAKDLREGIEIAKKLVEEGKPFKKLEALVSFMGDQDKLRTWKKKAGLRNA